jgi:ATP-dependent exoDNAse (exonuclease V) beta subunit
MTPAREVGASYFLEASAGTGKTTQLIDHIVHCVGAGTRLERIVAVTFTHAAAGEMKLRLREELGKAGESAADLELAFVGTIHSFCARLLRERPVEAGVDPRFVELDEQRAAALFAVVFRRWVERRLSEPSPTLRRAITRLTWRDDGEGRDPLASLRKAAWSLVEWRDHPTPWAHPTVDRAAALDSIVAGAREIAAMRRECRSGDSLIWGLTSVAEFAARADRREAISARDDDVLESDAIGLRRDARLRYLKKGTGYLSKTVKRDELYDRWGRLALEIGRFRDAVDADLAASLRDELWELVGLYQEAKQRVGQVDFSDLLFRARDLLQNDDARGYFQSRFDRIFVDEFQDTDPVQAEVLLLLAANDVTVRDWPQAIPKPGKLFLVGDPKQSIYQFRRADVERYQRVKSILTGAGVRQETLQVCRRAVQPILDFVNAAFEPLMREKYLPLVGGRPAIEGQPAIIALPMPSPYSKRNVSAKAIEKCAPDAVAGFVQWLIEESGWHVRDPETLQLVAVAPEHVCILFRNFFSTFTGDVTREYVRALEARNIPHILVGSKSFHGREEILVIRAALRAVEWPDDSLSVYATLRGPLFAISDESLLLFRSATASLPHPLRRLPDDLDAAFAPIREALEYLADLHRARNGRPIAATLNLLLEHVRAHAGFALRKGGERVLANVYRLIDIARRFEVNDATSFRAFIEYLEDESAGGETTETPLLERKTSGVTLMTAHKSKGLEFPVVILADMNSGLVRWEGPSRHIDSDRGLAAQRLLGWAPHDLTENAERESQRDREEGWRLAYVAATRARDLLVVTATGDEIREESWLNPLYPALYPPKGQWSHPEPPPGCEFRGRDTVLHRPMEVEPEEILRPGQHFAATGSHKVVWFDPSILSNRPETDAGIDDASLLSPTLTEPAGGLRQFGEWRAARARRHTEGATPTLRIRRISELDALPEGVEAEVEIRSVSAPESVRIKRGRKYGDLVHALLARTRPPVDRALLEVRAAAYEIGAALSEGDRQAAVEAVLRCLEDPLLVEARRAERVHREYPITYEIGGELYEGVIDLTWFDGSRWTVLDYKTGPADEPRYRRQVAIYGEALRMATGAPVRLIVLEII